MTTLQGHLERITYRHETSPFTIAKVRVEETHRLVTVIGSMAGVQPGDNIEVLGSWDTHPKYGQQFKVRAMKVIPAEPLEGIRKFLTSGLIKGIGPKMAGKLLAHFDASLLEVFEETPERLCEIPGIGSAKAARMASDWRAHQGTRRAMLMLQASGVKPYHAARIIKVFGPEAVEVLKNDPYRLSTEIGEIDFFLADTLARQMGMDPTDLRRLQACLLYLLEQSAGSGDSFMPRETLLTKCAQVLQVPGEDVETALTSLSTAGLVKSDTVKTEPVTDGVYLAALHEAETGIAVRLKALLSVPMAPAAIDPDRITHEVVRKLAIQPSEMQLAVLTEVLSHRAVIITGGPGTGKTTLIRSVCAVFEALRQRIILTAPTGRAARRLSEVTRRKAATLHKALGCNLEDGHFEKDRDNPLEADVVIVDEASMVDVLLMHHLIQAVPMTAILVLVGDVSQLPPVGPGNVLGDLIASGAIPAFELTEIFRQAQESPIVMNAHRVRQGRMPELPRPEDLDGQTEFFFMEQPAPARAAETVVALCTEELPRRFGLDPVRDIQVLTPMHKGQAGTIQLNQLLQKALNPASEKTHRKQGRTYHKGDKVMHLKNNYQKDVFNGDIGTICHVDNGAEELSVDFEGREVVYEFNELDELSLAYAISVHKSQGSEYPAVIVPLLTEHFNLLQRNLLYTAMTRGRRLVVLVGDRRAIDIALKNDKPGQRLSGLAGRM
jgi:exodeoxyribonuclease V alpha subunit